MSETEAKGSSFFKIFLDKDRRAERMRIPSAFRKSMKGTKSGSVYFSGRGEDSTWQVKLAKDKSCALYFGRGWKEFVNDHFICSGDFLIFKFDGEVNFKVTIYDPTGCEKHTATASEEEEQLQEQLQDMEIESEAVDLEGAASSSADPFFIVTIKKHNVSMPWFLDIPLEFARQYLDGFENKEMVICGEEGKEWPVSIVWGKSRCSIKGGWWVFVRDNQLQVGATCKFELLQCEPLRFLATISSRNA